MPTPESAYTGAWLVKLLVLLAKVLLSIFLIMLIRWTIPRFRFDQLMELTWKVFIPLSLANVVAVMTVLQFGLEPLVAAADFDRAVRAVRRSSA